MLLLYNYRSTVLEQSFLKPMNVCSDGSTSNQYQALLKKILTEGEEVGTWQEKLLRKVDNQERERSPEDARALRIKGHVMRFTLSQGFPVITERNLSNPLFNMALAEHIAFLNGAHTQEELEQFGCPWWDRWLTKEKCRQFGLEEGDLGPGSYGCAWRSFPTAEGHSVDQIKNVIQQIKDAPYSRTHRITNWIPQYIVPGENNNRKVVVAPCHGDIQIFINPEKGKMDISHTQRSADVPVGLAFNIIQYAAFGLMMSHITGYEFRDLVYIIQDAHIYKGQITDAKRMLEEPLRPFPGVKLETDDISQITEFRPSNFTLEDYASGPRRKIWTPT